MPQFDDNADRIVVFNLGDEYVCSHYVHREDVIEELAEYYDRDDYRFEMPESDFDETRKFLENNYYEVELINDVESFCVVKVQYTEHAEILRTSVLH